jgi:hypothetical protein
MDVYVFPEDASDKELAAEAALLRQFYEKIVIEGRSIYAYEQLDYRCAVDSGESSLQS